MQEQAARLAGAVGVFHTGDAPAAAPALRPAAVRAPAPSPARAAVKALPAKPARAPLAPHAPAGKPRSGEDEWEEF